MTTDGDVALASMRTFVGELIRGGATDACLSPGSRSTPIALAAARHGGLRVHVHLDERSSAFFALGLAKASGRPAIVVTTSGTAVANLLPAVVEASMSRTPLLLLTADRPPELRGTGANQTIDQVGIFGSYPRWSVDAPVPTATGTSADDQAWTDLAREALTEALGPPGGPVHVNLPFREPLVPSGTDPEPAGTGGGGAGASLRTAAHHAAPPPDAVMALATLIAGTERGLIVVGSLDSWSGGAEPSAIETLAAAAGWPVLAEPTSGLRRPPAALASGAHLAADEVFATEHMPEVVVQLGAAPTSRAILALASRTPRLVVVSPSPADPGVRASPWLPFDPLHMARACAGALDGAPRTNGWLAAWQAADRSVRAAVDRLLDGMDAPFEGRVARDLASTSPDGGTLFAGSSMPVRDLDAYMAPRRGLRVVGNRGASGIDGSISTALGLASAGPGPTCALVGDLAVLHDAGALLWSANAPTPMVLVVPNNQGGGIFDHLPVAAQPEHERLFVTPHRVDLEALAHVARAAYGRVERPGDLPEAVASASEGSGVSLVEVPIDRAAGIRARADVRAAVREALRRV